MADAQVWTVIALLAAAMALRAEVRADIAELRADLRRHVGNDHRPSA